MNLARHLDTVHEGQRLSDHGHIWHHFNSFENSFLAVGSFGDYFPVGLRLPDYPEPRTSYGVIIGYENSGHSRPGLSGIRMGPRAGCHVGIWTGRWGGVLICINS